MAGVSASLRRLAVKPTAELFDVNVKVTFSSGAYVRATCIWQVSVYEHCAYVSLNSTVYLKQVGGSMQSVN